MRPGKLILSVMLGAFLLPACNGPKEETPKSTDTSIKGITAYCPSASRTRDCIHGQGQDGHYPYDRGG